MPKVKNSALETTQAVQAKARMKNHFAYHVKKAVIIGISKYGELRKEETFKDVADLPAVTNDLKTV